MWLLVVTLAFKMYEGGGPAIIQVQVDSQDKCVKLGAEIIRDAQKHYDSVLGSVKLKGSSYHCYSL